MHDKQKSRNRRGSGSGDVVVPFFSHPIVACMDLVLKVVIRKGSPTILEKNKTLGLQLCYDLACSIQDRFGENHERLGAEIAADERAFWEKRSRVFRDAYLRLDEVRQRLRELEMWVSDCSNITRELRPDLELMDDPQFCRLWRIACPNGDSLPDGDLASRLEVKMMERHNDTVGEFRSARGSIWDAKKKASTKDRTAFSRAMDSLVGARCDAMFDLRISRMMEISDVSRRLVFQDDGDWITRFWIEADLLAKTPREFSADTIALRDLSIAQSVLDRELAEAAEKKRKANRDEALNEWVCDSGYYYGIKTSGFDRNAAYKTCIRQDQRVDSWLREMGQGGLVEYLAMDKTQQFVALEAHVRSGLLKEQNEYSVMADRLAIPGRRIIYLGEEPLFLPSGADGDRIRSRIVDLGGAVGNVFESKAHLIDRLRRFLPIRLHKR